MLNILDSNIHMDALKFISQALSVSAGLSKMFEVSSCHDRVQNIIY